MLDPSAKACPQCGRPNPTKTGRPILIGAAIVTAAVIGWWGASGPSAPATSAAVPSQGAEPAAPAAPSPAPAIEMTAAELHREYEENEVAADEKYKGKRLLVSGSVESIDKDFLDHIIVRLKTGQMFQSVMATMDDREKGAAAALKKRQAIAVLCRGGTRIVGSATLDDCVFR